MRLEHDSVRAVMGAIDRMREIEIETQTSRINDTQIRSLGEAGE